MKREPYLTTCLIVRHSNAQKFCLIWSSRNEKKKLESGTFLYLKVPKVSIVVSKISLVRAQAEAEVFKMMKSGKRQKKAWKRMVTKVCFVPEDFTRKMPKYERFIRPMAMRFKKAHVTHPELKATFCLPIIGVKKNPSSPMFTSLGVITKGTVIEVNISELGLVTQESFQS